MTRRLTERSGVPATWSEGPPAASAFSATALPDAALLVLLSLVPLRVFLAEQYSFEVPRWFRYLDAPGGAGPGATLLLVGVVAAVGLALAVRRLWTGGPRWRPTGGELGAVLLAIAGAIACARAGQKQLALVGTLDFLGLVVYFLLLRQLLTAPWRIRLALYVIVAAGTAVLVKAAYQVWVEIPETIAYFQEHHAEEMSRRLGPQELGRLYDFKQRLTGGAARGYFAHSNVFGSYLILVMAAGVAIACDRWRRAPRVSLVIPLVVATATFVGMAGSQSKGAVAAGAIAVALMVLGSRLVRRGPDGRMIRSPAKLALAAWAAFAVLAIGLVALLNVAPDALGRSMHFRWLYWKGAAHLLDAEGPWGVGANNFGRFFARYKPVECPEEVQDPHSWPVRLLTEWGVIGLVGGIALFVGVTVHLARLTRRPPAPTSDANGPPRSLVLWMAAVAAVSIGGLWASLAGTDVGFIALALFLAATPLVIAGIALGFESASPEIANRPLGAIGPALCAGLIGFLLHAGVDLALFWPGAAATFFSLMAVAVAHAELSVGRAVSVGASPHASNRPRAHVLPQRFRPAAGLSLAVLAIVVLTVYFQLLVRPALDVGRLLHAARRDPGPAEWDAYLASPNALAYREAAERLPWDATALDEYLDALVTRARTLAHTDVALPLLPKLRARDPFDSAADHHEATLRIQRYVLSGDAAELDRAIERMWAVVDDFPTAPDLRVSLAEMYHKKCEATGELAARHSAIVQYGMALDLDAKRVFVSPLNRYPPLRRAELAARIAALSGRPNASSAPVAP